MLAHLLVPSVLQSKRPEDLDQDKTRDGIHYRHALLTPAQLTLAVSLRVTNLTMWDAIVDF